MFRGDPWEISSFLNKGNREEVDLWDMGGKTEPGRGGEIGNFSCYVINERI